MLVTNATLSFAVSNVYITAINIPGNEITVNLSVSFGSSNGLRFGPFVEFSKFPQQFTGVLADDWYIEESRIRGGYNNTTVDFGVKAYAVDEVKNGEVRKNALIYSGIYNSRTG
jgi:hypothetical protein